MRVEKRIDHRLAAAVLAAAAFAIEVSAGASADTADRDGGHLWQIGEEHILLGPYELAVHAPYRSISPTEGIGREAARFDGNSTWAQSQEPVTLPIGDSFAVAAEVVFASPPVNDTSILHLRGQEGELRLAVGPWMQPEFRVGPLRAADFGQLPLGRRVHLAATFDGETARLFVDGEEVARTEAGHDDTIPDQLSGTMTIGKSQDAGVRYETHPLGVFNGMIDALRLHIGSPDQIRPPESRSTDADIGVPDSWFADDPHRPVLHPMPPAGWTNEPHTLLQRDGIWHLYYQANPNGAFWEAIVWGHLASDDLVDWQPRLPALMPGTGFDRRGIWVGNLIPDIEPPAVLYTGVDGERSGLGRADWREGGAFERREPAISYGTPPGYQDMRDPYIVRRDEDWLALVGSGTHDHTAPLILAFTSRDGVEWEFVGEFDTGSAAMPGEYWELPMLLPIGERWLLMGTPVRREEATQTLYWIGDFDGTRFVPDDIEPRGFDLFRTLLSPTLAEAQDGRLIGIGVVPDDGQRPEDVRARAGWVHALSLPFEITQCDDRPGELCSALARELDEALASPVRFEQELPAELTEAPVEIAFGDAPVRLTGEIIVPAGDEATLALETQGGEGVVTRLILRPAEGRIALDNDVEPQFDWARVDVLEAQVRPNETLFVDLVIDGAAVTGTLGTKPFSALLYPREAAARRVVLTGEGAAQVEWLKAREFAE